MYRGDVLFDFMQSHGEKRILKECDFFICTSCGSLLEYKERFKGADGYGIERKCKGIFLKR